MYDRKKLTEMQQAQDKWEEDMLNPTLSRFPERQEEFITASSEPIEKIYTPLDVQDLDFEDDLGMPGEYPYTTACMHAAAYGPCACSLVSAQPKRPTSVSNSCSNKVKPGFLSLSICPP